MSNYRIDEFIEEPRHRRILRLVRDRKRRGVLLHLGLCLALLGVAASSLSAGMLHDRAVLVWAGFSLLAVFVSLLLFGQWVLVVAFFEITEKIEAGVGEAGRGARSDSESTSSSTLKKA